MIKATLLRKVFLFQGLSELEIEALAEAATIHRLPRKTRVIIAEAEGYTFFVISKGKVKVSLSGTDGREVILTTLGPGNFFGDMSLLDGRPRSADVATTERSELLALRRTDFLKLVDEKPEIAIELLKVIASRLRKANLQIAGLSFLGIIDRVCDAILSFFDDQGEELPEGVLIHNRPRLQTLAQMTGATRETVSRAIRKLEEGGYIAVKGKDVLFLRSRRRSLYRKTKKS